MELRIFTETQQGATGERFDRFEEQLAVITGLWETPVGETFSFDGTHYPVQDSPALPKPVQSPRPPVLIGGRGKKRTPPSPRGTPTSSTCRSSTRR